MRHPVLRALPVVVLLVALAAVAAAADAPALLSSDPRDGATDVALDVGVVRLVFDRPMKQNSHTLWGSDRGALPPLSGDRPVVWKDDRTCEIRLGALEPDTAYALQLNSRQKQGFRSAEGNEPLPVTVLTFHTAAAPAPDPQPPQPEGVPDSSPKLADLMAMSTEEVAGNWEARTPGSVVVTYLVIEAKGWARKYARMGEAVLEHWDGVAGYRDGHLYVWDNSFTPPLLKLACRRDGDRIHLTEGDDTQEFRRAGGAPEAVEETPVPEERLDPKQILPGEWWYEDEDLRWTFGFDAEGNFSSRETRKADGEVAESEGTWSLEGERLVLRYATGRTLKQGIKVADRDTVEITDSKGVVLRILRDDVDHAPGGPAELPGVWEAKQRGQTVRLTLWSDGRMARELPDGEAPSRSLGRYKVVGEAFLMRLNGREEMRFRFRWIDRSRWSIPGEGEAMDFRRVGEAPDGEEGPTPPPRPPEEEEPAVIGPALLVGGWEADEDDVRLVLTLSADGTYTLTATQEGETETMKGTWTLAGRTLTVTPEGEEATPLEVKALDSKTLVLVDDGGEEVTFTAQARPPKGRGLFGGKEKEKEPPKPPAPRIAGEWLVRTSEMEIRLSLKPDGTFREVVRTMQGTEVTEGRYEVQGSKFIAHPEGKETRSFNVRLVDADTLEILDDQGNGVQMKRQ